MSWRRGQDSNLHSLSAGGFQDREVGLDLIRLPRIYQYKSGCAAIKVIEVEVGSFPSARHLSAKFPWLQSSSVYRSATPAQARVARLRFGILYSFIAGLQQTPLSKLRIHAAAQLVLHDYCPVTQCAPLETEQLHQSEEHPAGRSDHGCHR